MTLTPDHARDVLAEIDRRGARLRAPSPRDGLFPEQLAFFNDKAQFAAALCTRRAGKSHVAAALLFHHAARVPNVTALYIALTRDSAKEIIWPVLLAMNDKYQLGGIPTASALTLHMPNGAKIRCAGADMANFISRLRGPAYSIAVIDEAQSFGSHIRELIDEVLEPALGDHRGPCRLMGTPGPLPHGLFFDITEKNLGGYSLHKWSIHNNPHFPHAESYITELKRRRSWTDLNPTYIREWCGRWVNDPDALVYRFNRERNLYENLPAGHDYVRILSIDYGWNDQTALAVLAYAHGLREVFVEHSEGHSEIIPSDIAARIGILREKYNPIRIVADTGGLGKSITEEFIRRYSIPIKAAEKTEKLTNISLLNGDFIDRKLWIHSSLTDVMDQYETLTKGEDHKEDPRLPNDFCDAVLYGFREAKHYLGEPKEPPGAQGTPEAYAQEAKRMMEREMAKMEQAENAPAWWEQ